MKSTPIRHLLFIFISLLAYQRANSQERSVDYVLGTAEMVITNSQYNRITVLDAREDTTQLGFTLTGAFNRLALLVPKVDVKDQLRAFFISAIDSTTASKGELVVVIRNWQYSELSGGRLSEEGYCNLRFSFFAKKEDKYFLLTTYSNRVKVSGGEVSNRIQQAVKEQLNIYARSSLKSAAAIGMPFYRHQLEKIEQYEKDELPVFSSSKWVDGLYLSYNSFKRQTPDLKIMAVLQGDKISKIKFQDKQGKWKKWKGENQYAIIFDGKAFIYTETGYYPIKRLDRKLQFVGLMPKMGNTVNVSFGIMIGMVGAFIAPTAREWYLVEIDHLDGCFNYVRFDTHLD